LQILVFVFGRIAGTTQDKDGNMLTAHTDFEKAEVLGNYFSSVFNRERLL